MYCKNRISDNLWAGKTNEEDEGEGKMLKIMHKIDRRKAAAVLVILLVMILSVTDFFQRRQATRRIMRKQSKRSMKRKRMS